MRLIAHIAILIAWGVSLGWPKTGMHREEVSNMDEMNTPITQKQLDASKGWKEYKALMANVEKASSTSELKPLIFNSAHTHRDLKLIFANEELLVADFISLKEATIAGMREMLTPKPGRMPAPDFERLISRTFSSLQRNFRIVSGFERLRLRDEFVEAIKDRLPKSISNQRAAILSLREGRARQGPSESSVARADLDSMEMEIQALEDSVNLWYEHDVKMGLKPPKTKPEQSDFDKSESWQKYVLLHRKIQQAKSESDFADIPSRVSSLKDSLIALFQDAALVSDLETWLLSEMGARTKSLRPKSPKPAGYDPWDDLLAQYRHLQVCFRIVTSFRSKGLDEVLTRTMATPLPIEVHNLYVDVLTMHSGVKGIPQDRKELEFEFKAFDDTVQKAYASWKKAKR